MADPMWKTHLVPKFATVTESIYVTGTLLDKLVQYGLINIRQRGRIDLAGIESDKAAKLFEILITRPPTSFETFCQALDETEHEHLAKILRDEKHLERQDSTVQPETRLCHESVFLNGSIYLFGGWNFSTYLSRNLIWRFKVLKREWRRFVVQGRKIPPPCIKAQCVTMNQRIFSYGGKKESGDRLGIVYCLDPTEMKWSEVSPHEEENKPANRFACCLCAISRSKMVMFGGNTGNVSRDQLQYEACKDEDDWSDEIFEFQLDGNDEGAWSDLKLSGYRPNPLQDAAMIPIDQHRLFLYGIDSKNATHSLVINLIAQAWVIITFDVIPSPRKGHSLCDFVIEGLEGKLLGLLTGGHLIPGKSDYVYLFDYESLMAYQIDEPNASIVDHTSHSVQSEGQKTIVFLCGGPGPILTFFQFDSRSKSYIELRSSMILDEMQSAARQKPDEERADSRPPFDKNTFMRQDLESCQKEVDEIQRCFQQCNDVIDPLRQKLLLSQSKADELDRLLQEKNRENLTLSQKLSDQQSDQAKISTLTLELGKTQRHLRIHVEEISTLREELDNAQRSLQNKNEENATLRNELSSARERLPVGSHVSQTERSRNEVTNTLTNRLISYGNLLLLLAFLTAYVVFYIGDTKTSSSTNSSPLSFYDARWNDFSWIICEAGFSKWQDIGYWLGYDWQSLQAISERGQGSKIHCRFLLAKYVEKNGDSREMRKRVVKACDDVHIGGRLKDIVKGKGYSI
ncbi:uncharacterized protein [Oscarella lobularis]|uniref:uncharacterized protein isoform X1 n=1 Tax=Oscarella lobularis TaxID=121494 RepID=UPI00331395E5